MCEVLCYYGHRGGVAKVSFGGDGCRCREPNSVSKVEFVVGSLPLVCANFAPQFLFPAIVAGKCGFNVCRLESYSRHAAVGKSYSTARAYQPPIIPALLVLTYFSHLGSDDLLCSTKVDTNG